MTNEVATTASSTVKSRDLALSLGMTAKEFDHCIAVLGREPRLAEIQMIAVMWSEHCSYKSSKRFLKKLMTSGDAVLQGPGENAGLVAYGKSHALAFKIESHNHPSFVEPFQGAATGVGGILRDIFTMGARPVALGDYLRFGDLTTDQHRHLCEGVVSGIAHYGNCMGIPVVGGQIASDPSYNGNILVNVFCMGLARRDEIAKSDTAKPGEVVMVWGARTGRDGIHGASLLASHEFDETAGESLEHKIRVQVGDPFKEKVLMEATLEAMRDLKADLSAIQDMGAAGLTSSTTEMAAKSKVGMRIELSQVPVRELGMQAWELLLSESQERMLAIVRKGSESRFQKLLEKWGCEGAVIGETTSDQNLKMFWEGDLVVDLPIQDLIEAPPADLPEPQQTMAPRLSQTVEEVASIERTGLSERADIKGESEILLSLLKDPRVASKQKIFERYDTTVGNATLLGPGHEAAVLWLPTEERPQGAVAFKGFAEELIAVEDPRAAARLALMKALRSLFCVGAKPLAYTDGLNVGHALDADVQFALRETIEGFNEVASAFGTPCISGNVSMYNQTSRGGKSVAIMPTNFVVAVGDFVDLSRALPSCFQHAGSEVWSLSVSGSPHRLPVGSLYALKVWGALKALPYLNLEKEKKLRDLLDQLHRRSLLRSIRDCGAGGMAVSLAKASLLAGSLRIGKHAKLGFEGDLSKTQMRRDYLLFNEDQGHVIVELDGKNRAELMKWAEAYGIEAKKVGMVTEAPRFSLRPTLSIDLDRLEKAWTSVYE